jgi:hypothetical protein
MMRRGGEGRGREGGMPQLSISLWNAFELRLEFKRETTYQIVFVREED